MRMSELKSVQECKDDSLVSCADAIALCLKKLNVDVVFGVVGIPITPVAYACQRYGLQYYGMRTENAAGYAASGYAYWTSHKRCPGVMLTTGGPGFVNSLAGLAHATVNRFPLVVIGGSCRTEHRGRGGFQELNQVECCKGSPNLCKASFWCEKSNNVFYCIQEAFLEALKGPPGGVYVDFPVDVLESSVPKATLQDFLALTNSNLASIGNTLNDECRKLVRKMNDLLYSSSAPLVVVGKGAAMSCSELLVQEYASLFQLPILPTPTGRGIIPDTSRFCVSSVRSWALREADTVLLLGCRLNWMLHFGDPPRWKPDVRFILVDVDPSGAEDARVALTLVGDVSQILQLALDHEKRQGRLPPAEPTVWVKSLVDQAASRREDIEHNLTEHEGDSEENGLMFRSVLNHLRHVLIRWHQNDPKRRLFLVAEGSTTMDVSRVCLPVFQPRSRLDAGTWGTMGVGLPYTFAACVAAASLERDDDDNLVVAVEGDSAIGFSLGELETMTRYQVSPIILVLNNGGIYTGAVGSPPVPTQLSKKTRYDQILASCGGTGYFVKTYADLETVLNEVVLSREQIPKKQRRAALICVCMDSFDTGGTTAHAQVLGFGKATTTT